ncbi:MAG: hypothetical protein M5T61_20045 [Acidimicrobiia bacterium]|nr:hypothetical protein [Acidimicrobiia bacterium]
MPSRTYSLTRSYSFASSGDSGYFCGLRIALREQLRAVEPQQFFLDHTAHEVSGRLVAVHTLAELAREAVPVDEGHEQLEVLGPAVVRRRRHQQQVARNLPEPLA